MQEYSSPSGLASTWDLRGFMQQNASSGWLSLQNTVISRSTAQWTALAMASMKAARPAPTVAQCSYGIKLVGSALIRCAQEPPARPDLLRHSFQRHLLHASIHILDALHHELQVLLDSQILQRSSCCAIAGTCATATGAQHASRLGL